MSKSLQDQLLALGLAREFRARAVGRDKSNPRPVQKRKPGTPARQGRHSAASEQKELSADLTLAEAYQLREKQTRQQADLVRERKLQEDRRRRQLNNDIRAIVNPNRLNDPAAELSRNFIYKGRIRKVNLTADQLKALNEGVLGLVYLAGGYHVLAAEYISQVRLLSEDHVPELSGASEDDEDHPVPDDLIW